MSKWSPDEAHIWTDEQLKALEKRITAEYKKAAEELQSKIDAYFEHFKKRDAEQLAKLREGEITEESYKQWRLAQIGRGRRFEALRDRIAERMTNANEVAAAYINDTTPGLYSLNRNFSAYTIEQQVGADVGFNLWDEQTVRRLIVEQPDLMPYYPPKRAVQRGFDLVYGKKQITAQITSGILQGESIKHLADRLQNKIPDMNRTSAIRAARTAVTAAQNGGRLDSYFFAEEMGIELEKSWMATLDNRTRHAHAHADGLTVRTEEPFIVGGEELMFPGDGSHGASVWNLYNCRCTMIARVKGVDMSDANRRVRNPETGESIVIENMTYTEWEKWVQKRRYSDIIGAETSNRITIQSIAAHTIDRASERGVLHTDVLNAITSPLHIGEIKTDQYGRRSQRFIGSNATVNINPDTGNVVTVWPTGKDTRKKYQGGD